MSVNSNSNPQPDSRQLQPMLTAAQLRALKMIAKYDHAWRGWLQPTSRNWSISTDEHSADPISARVMNVLKAANLVKIEKVNDLDYAMLTEAGRIALAAHNYAAHTTPLHADDDTVLVSVGGRIEAVNGDLITVDKDTQRVETVAPIPQQEAPMTANRKLTALRRTLLHKIEASHGNASIDNYRGSIYAAVNWLVTNGYLEQDHQWLTLTALGRAAIGTSADSVPSVQAEPTAQDAHMRVVINVASAYEQKPKGSILLEAVTKAVVSSIQRIGEDKYILHLTDGSEMGSRGKDRLIITFVKDDEFRAKYLAMGFTDEEMATPPNLPPRDEYASPLDEREPLPFDGTPQPSDDAAVDAPLTPIEITCLRAYANYDNKAEYQRYRDMLPYRDFMSARDSLCLKDYLDMIDEDALRINDAGREALRRIDGGSVQR